MVVFFPNYSFAFDDGDFQYWNTENLSYNINKNWKIKVEEEFRFGDDASDFYYQHSDAGATYSGIANWLDIGLNYRLVFEEKSDGWSYENRPHLNATLKYTLEGFKLRNRGRLEYRDKESGEDGWRYRNKFAIRYPIKIKDFEISPYIADEIFVDFIAEELNRNRLYAGMDFKILKNLKLDVFYLWQSSKNGGTWIDYNILGTKLKLSF